MLQRVDRKVVVSGDADLALDAKGTQLKGRLRADEGRFDFTQSDAPALADDVDVDRGRGEAETRDTAPATRRTLALDLRADLGDSFVLRGRGLNTRLAGELRLTSPANKLAVHATSAPSTAPTPPTARSCASSARSSPSPACRRTRGSTSKPSART